MSEKEAIQDAIKLYVLLDRIGKVEEYIWDDLDYNKETDEFVKILGKLEEYEQKCGLNVKQILLNNKLLTGVIKKSDRVYGRGTDKLSCCINTNIEGETLLHRAITLLPTNKSEENNDNKKYRELARQNHNLETVITELIEKAPCLLEYDRKNFPKYDGQTSLHIAILKENLKVIKQIVAKLKLEDEDREKQKLKGPGYRSILEIKAKGSSFKATPMMAGSPLCVAALTFNKKVFHYLIQKRCNLTSVNKHGDNVLHSLVKYAYCRPTMLEKSLDMIDYIANCQWLSEKRTAGGANLNHLEKQIKMQEREILQLWMMYNSSNRNPLQVSVKLGLHEIFERIMSYKVYCMRNDKDGLFDVETYDITEIETAPERETKPEHKMKDIDHMTEDVAKTKSIVGKTKKQYSILRAILKLKNPKTAFAFIDFPPVRAVIDQKWDRYKYVFFVWGLIHVLFMGCLTASAIERSRISNNPFENTNESIYDPPNFIYSIEENVFLLIMMTLSGLFGLVGITSSLIVWFVGNKRKSSFHAGRWMNEFSNPYSNAIYKLFILLLCLCLLVDLIAAFASPLYENYLLIVSLILGWYLVLFFLQGIRPLAFFTALVQKVILDMLKFSVFMVVLLVAFSTSMFMIMQGAYTDDDSFSNMPHTMMKMFTIMLGLGDLDVLFTARHPIMAVIVFVLFVLLTTILLLNALIAMMSNTCTELMSDQGKVIAKEFHFSLQKLSVVLLIESMLPMFWFKVVGEKKYRSWFDDDKWYPARLRLVWEKKNVIDVEDENHHDDEGRNQMGGASEMRRYMAHMAQMMNSVSIDPRVNGMSTKTRDFPQQIPKLGREKVAITTIEHATNGLGGFQFHDNL